LVTIDEAQRRPDQRQKPVARDTVSGLNREPMQHCGIRVADRLNIDTGRQFTSDHRGPKPRDEGIGAAAPALGEPSTDVVVAR
jgi:hypothetical protein